MQTTVTTFRTDRDLQRKIKTLQRNVKPTRFNARRASTSDVIRTALETLYCTIAEGKTGPGEGGKIENAKAL